MFGRLRDEERSMIKALWYGTAPAGQAARKGKRARLQIQAKRTPDLFRSAMASWRPDVVLFDMNAPRAGAFALLEELQRRRPELPLVLLTSPRHARDKRLRLVLRGRTVDFVRAPVNMDELLQRIDRLLPGKGGRAVAPAAPAGPAAPRGVLRHLVPQLHDPQSGRLDAARVAALYGLPLATVARIAGRSLSAVHKTPDAAALQAALAPFERIAVSLLRIAGGPAPLRAWLNAPHPDLQDRTPLAVLQEGGADTVAELLEDALLGHPG
jgi:DNA-binding response OmpR family regulator